MGGSIFSWDKLQAIGSNSASQINWVWGTIAWNDFSWLQTLAFQRNVPYDLIIMVVIL